MHRSETGFLVVKSAESGVDYTQQEDSTFAMYLYVLFTGLGVRSKVIAWSHTDIIKNIIEKWSVVFDDRLLELRRQTQLEQQCSMP